VPEEKTEKVETIRSQPPLLAQLVLVVEAMEVVRVVLALLVQQVAVQE
jgi:hypothetical protein